MSWVYHVSAKYNLSSGFIILFRICLHNESSDHSTAIIAQIDMNVTMIDRDAFLQERVCVHLERPSHSSLSLRKCPSRKHLQVFNHGKYASRLRKRKTSKTAIGIEHVGMFHKCCLVCWMS